MNIIKKVLGFLFVALVVWVLVADLTFKLRHPWATDTERGLYLYQSLTFQKIPYNEMRPRE